MCIYVIHIYIITFYFSKDFQKCQLGSYRLSSLERNLKDDLFQHPPIPYACLIYSQCCSSFAWIVPMIKLMIPKANILDRSIGKAFSQFDLRQADTLFHTIALQSLKTTPMFQSILMNLLLFRLNQFILYLKICQPLYFPCSLSC